MSAQQADSLRITFVLLRDLDCSEEITTIHPEEFIKRLNASPIQYGGFCFIADQNKIWNARKTTRFNRRCVKCDTDSLSFCILFLETVIDQLEDSSRFKWLLTETVEVEITTPVEQTLTLTGRSISGTILYPPIAVPVFWFYEQLRSASSQFIQFANRLIEVAGEAQPAVDDFLRAVDIERWARAVERLTGLILTRFPDSAELR